MAKSKLKNYISVGMSFRITGLVILIMILLSFILPSLNNAIGSEATALLFQLLAMGIPFLIVRRTLRKKDLGNPFNMTLKNKRIIPFIVVGGVVLLLGTIGSITGLIPMSESTKVAYSQAASQVGFSTFLLMAVAAPITEELIFRGIILNGLLKKYSPTTSILVSSLLFGIVHLNPVQFVNGLIMGVFIGWVYYKSKSLLAAITIHATANFSVYFIRFFVDSSNLDQSYIENLGGITNYIVILVGSITVTAVCIYFLKVEFNKELETE